MEITMANPQPQTATITYIGEFGAIAKLNFEPGEPHPNGSFDISLHEAENPGIIRSAKIGDRIEVIAPPHRADDYPSSLGWKTV